MAQMIIILTILAFLILCFQGYSYVTTLTGKVRRDSCRQLGTFFFVLGICSFLTHSAPVVVAGMILLMFGLRLMANGLVRHGKTGFSNSERAEKIRG